jgi:hypothetical protein
MCGVESNISLLWSDTVPSVLCFYKHYVPPGLKIVSKDFACFAPLREIRGCVTTQLLKASHAKTQSTQRKKLIQKLDSFAASFIAQEMGEPL